MKYIIGVLIIGSISGGIYLLKPTSIPENVASSPLQATASFSIDEVLRGNPFTVVGSTTAVEGTVTATDSALTISPIRIAAGTFITDAPQRDNALRRFILDTETYPYITFTPKETQRTDALLSVSGDLTILGITQPTVFTGEVKENEGILSGTLTSVITRSAFNIRIPQVPFVASVEDPITLTISFSTPIETK